MPGLMGWRWLTSTGMICRISLNIKACVAPTTYIIWSAFPHSCDFCYKDAFFQGGRSFYTQPVDDALAEIERRVIRETLERTGGDKKTAATLLGIATRTIYRNLKKTVLASMTTNRAGMSATVAICQTIFSPACTGRIVRWVSCLLRMDSRLSLPAR